MRLNRTLILPLLALCLLFTGCDRRTEEPTAQEETAPAAPATTTEEDAEPPAPPAPPLLETFDGQPQLSLFPRAGAFRPENDDSEGLAYWRTFLDHMLKTSGIAGGAGLEESRAWALRSIKGLDSVGFFSPLAVTPETTYRVSFSFKGEQPEAGEAGIGILEFDEFLWIGEQYPESLAKEHLIGSHEGIRLSGNHDEWQEHAFTFTTSPRTGMVHLILFREGEALRKPVLFENIRIAPHEGD